MLKITKNRPATLEHTQPSHGRSYDIRHFDRVGITASTVSSAQTWPLLTSPASSSPSRDLQSFASQVRAAQEVRDAGTVGAELSSLAGRVPVTRPILASTHVIHQSARLASPVVGNRRNDPPRNALKKDPTPKKEGWGKIRHSNNNNNSEEEEEKKVV